MSRESRIAIDQPVVPQRRRVVLRFVRGLCVLRALPGGRVSSADVRVGVGPDPESQSAERRTLARTRGKRLQDRVVRRARTVGMTRPPAYHAGGRPAVRRRRRSFCGTFVMSGNGPWLPSLTDPAPPDHERVTLMSAGFGGLSTRPQV
jgi:hypothetical protein